MFVFCQDLHASESFHSTRPDSVVLQGGGVCLVKSATLCGYTQVVIIDEAVCLIVQACLLNRR